MRVIFSQGSLVCVVSVIHPRKMLLSSCCALEGPTHDAVPALISLCQLECRMTDAAVEHCVQCCDASRRKNFKAGAWEKTSSELSLEEQKQTWLKGTGRWGTITQWLLRVRRFWCLLEKLSPLKLKSYISGIISSSFTNEWAKLQEDHIVGKSLSQDLNPGLSALVFAV